MTDTGERVRASDHGILCTIALRASQLWDFIDKRDIDKHFTALTIIGVMLIGTIRLTEWGMDYADRWIAAEQAGHVIQGSEIALVLGAVLGPWGLTVTGTLAAVVSFYFRARQ